MSYVFYINNVDEFVSISCQVSVSMVKENMSQHIIYLGKIYRNILDIIFNMNEVLLFFLVTEIN
jgi:hypothetical protein